MPPAANFCTRPPRFIVALAIGTVPSEDGEADAPGALAAGIELTPLADIPAPELAAGAGEGPLAENGLGFPGGVVGVTVGRLAA